MNKKLIEKAAGVFFCDDDLLSAYELLVNLKNHGKANELANNYVLMWEQCINMRVGDIVDNIDSLADSFCPEFIKKMDWNLLNVQKTAILETINNGNVDPEHKEALEGILSLVDNIQDSAVDYFGFDEDLVFEFKKEE